MNQAAAERPEPGRDATTTELTVIGHLLTGRATCRWLGHNVTTGVIEVTSSDCGWCGPARETNPGSAAAGGTAHQGRIAHLEQGEWKEIRNAALASPTSDTAVTD